VLLWLVVATWQPSVIRGECPDLPKGWSFAGISNNDPTGEWPRRRINRGAATGANANSTGQEIVGGRDTGSPRAALTVSDAILIPFRPRSVDLWAGVQIDALVPRLVP